MKASLSTGWLGLLSFGCLAALGFQAEAALSIPMPTEGGATVEDVTTNYYVSTPGLVVIAFGTMDFSSERLTGAYSDGGVDAPNDASVGHGPDNVTITDPNGTEVAYLSLTNSGHATTAGAVVSAKGSALSFTGEFTDEGADASISYMSANNGSANNLISGNGVVTFTSTSYHAPTTPPGYGVSVTESAGLADTGTFTFYAPSSGTYTIHETAPGSDTVINGNVMPAWGVQTMWGDTITITSISQSAALPTGSLRATNGGANGVTLQWSITPP